MANQAIAGWVISEVNFDKFGNKQFQTTFIQNNMIRFETQSSIALINLNTNNISLVFSMHKLYWEGSIEEFKKSTISIFEQKLQNIVLTADAEHKEMARELIENLKQKENEVNTDTLRNVNLKINKTEITEIVANFPSTKYEIFVFDSLVESIWITDSINPYKDIDIENMISFTNELKPKNTNINIEGTSEYLNLIKKGLVVKSEEKNPLGGYLTTMIEEVVEVEINIDIFSPPANYRKAQLTEILLIRDDDSEYYKLEQEFQNAKQNPFND